MSPPVAGPFSQDNRVRLIAEYFAQRAVDPSEAWRDVYRLLLWCDPTTGLAHCYESDKAQPGRPWYARTLAFHNWLGEQFRLGNDELVDALDWMFRQVIAQVASEEAAKHAALAPKAEVQREAYDLMMPAPNDDPELRLVIEPLLPQDHTRPNDDVIRDVLRRVRTHITSENKRKNLLGRGFEDVLSAVVSRLDGHKPPIIATQIAIQDIRGFRAPRSGDKDEKVDLYVETSTGRRILVSAKWPVRADREKQMLGDFHTYVACNEMREPFEYAWITNEFDPARLVANATNSEANRYLFDRVVHICPEALRLVHDLGQRTLPRTRAALKDQLEHRRITGLAEWLRALEPGA